MRESDTKQTPKIPAETPEETENISTKGKKNVEVGGPSGPEPTRYGDWERKGICVDF